MHLLNFFDANTDLRMINSGGARGFRQSLVDSGKAEATISKTIKHCRYFLKCAVQDGLISENPFDEIKTGRETNKDRQRLILSETIQRVIKAAPDHEWRTIIALARYAGFRRCEIPALEWSNIDWGDSGHPGELVIDSPKTGIRTLPLFGELRPYLEASWDAASVGARYVVERHRKLFRTNPATQLKRIIKKAGIETWPKPFHNLRATLQSELTGRYPEPTVNEWLGNSQDVARRHYLQVLPEHMSQAATEVVRALECADDRNFGEGVHNACRIESHHVAVSDESATACELLRNDAIEKAPPARLELATRRLTAACSTN
jgi:integrase